MASSKARSGKVSGLWVTLENGTEATESKELIRMAIDRIRSKRELVSLVHKGYQCPKALIVASDRESLEIDRPPDWPGTESVIHILFKDDSQVWNKVRTKVLRATDNSIFVEFPSSLVRLQRRSNYRVGVPSGSTAVFMHKDQRCQGFQVLDVSASGAQLCVGRYYPMEAGDRLTDLKLFFPGPISDLTQGTHLSIRIARVMRSGRGDNKKYCYGISFDLAQGEEEALLQYVRQRERELLRKGVG